MHIGYMEGEWRVMESVQGGKEWLLAIIDLVGDNWEFLSYCIV